MPQTADYRLMQDLIVQLEVELQTVLAGFTTTGIGATTSGSGDNTATFDVFRDVTGGIGTVSVVNQGSGYAAGDTLLLQHPRSVSLNLQM